MNESSNKAAFMVTLIPVTEGRRRDMYAYIIECDVFGETSREYMPIGCVGKEICWVNDFAVTEDKDTYIATFHQS